MEKINLEKNQKNKMKTIDGSLMKAPQRYIKYKNDGFEVDTTDGDSFYSLNLVDSFLKEIGSLNINSKKICHYDLARDAFNIAKKIGANKTSKNFTDTAKIIYSNLFVKNTLEEEYGDYLNKLDQEIKKKVINLIAKKFGELKSEGDIINLFKEGYVLID